MEARVRFFVLSPNEKEVHIKQFGHTQNAAEFHNYIEKRGLKYIMMRMRKTKSNESKWLESDGYCIHEVKELLNSGKAVLVSTNMNSKGG